MTTPRATYRVQLNAQLDFDAAAQLADYLAALGVSHLYASPYLQAAPGSTHGYDVVDHQALNEELGGEAAFERMCAALEANGLSQVLDIVPNHMAIGTERNQWWWDVLENGLASPYARCFDVDWRARRGASDDRVLLPVLGDQYGRVVESGEVRVELTDGRILVRYYERVFPASPESIGQLLGAAAERADSDELAYLAGAYARLPEPDDRRQARRRSRDKAFLEELLRRALEDSALEENVRAQIEVTNSDADTLDAFLAVQNYRLAYWRTSRHELEYRRFFDIDNLVGLHMEDPEVFEDTHVLIAQLVDRGVVTGLRLDHVDGLRDPKAYLSKLRERTPTAWIVAEKILMPNEHLPDGWPVAGTTGYDFLRQVNGLLLSPEGLAALDTTYGVLIGAERDWEAMVRDAKMGVLDDGLRADMDRLVELLFEVCDHHRRHRDHSRFTLRTVLRALIASFPVYRTYVVARDETPSLRDRAFVEEALRRTREQLPDADRELLDWLQDLLLLRHRGPLEQEFAARFSQLAGPAMAKGVEDTAGYRFNRLISTNEVGVEPDEPVVGVADFHHAMAERALKHPLAMLTTSTHDTKRSEDVRARLAVLTEIPERWSSAVAEWLSHNARHRTEAGPDRNTEYLFYQTVVGAWPIDEERAVAYMRKAAREAKVHTSWTAPDEAYESALEGFVRAALADEAFVASLAALVDEILEAGRINALTQTLLKLTAPGVPDIYQGCELWDLSLVDPDNRRPVDYALRRRLLNELEGASPEAIMARMDEGLPKLHVTKKTLASRASDSTAFERAGYRALSVTGAKAEKVIAFSRDDRWLVVAPRLTRSIGDWQDTTIALPDGRFDDVFTGDERGGGDVRVGDLLSRFPVALLQARTS